MIRPWLVPGLLAALAGCASYTRPGGAVSLTEVTQAGIAEAMSRRPAVTFPSRLILVRVQAAFVDVRTGYVYGVAEASAEQTQRSDLWSTGRAIENARLKAEREAFQSALAEIEKTWGSIYAQYARQ